MTQKEIIEKPESVAFILSNYATMNNPEMAKHLGVCVQYVRTVCYEHGLKRMELEYWNEEQVQFLKKKFKTCGDKELAEIFNSKWPKQKGWTLKHIEKKRKYLNLKRTEKQLYKIKEKAKRKGVYVLGLEKTWMSRGAAPEGSVVIWATDSQWPTKHIKINGKYQNYHRYLWRKAGRYIPKGKRITTKPGISDAKSADDLECVTIAELALRNVSSSSKGLSDNYIAGIMTINNPGIREMVRNDKDLLGLKRQQLLLQREINKQK